MKEEFKIISEHDPTVNDIWQTLSNDVKEAVYEAAGALMNARRIVPLIRRDLYDGLDRDQKIVVDYIVGAAANRKDFDLQWLTYGKQYEREEVD